MNGFALNIDDSFLKTLAEVDKQMSSLMKKKTKFSKGIVEAFQEISKSGVEPFVAKLKQTQDALNAISNVPVQGKASAKLKKLQADASLCADNVNKLILAMQGLSTSADTQREWKAFDNVQRVNQLYSDRIHYMQQLESIVRKGSTSEAVNPSALSSNISILQNKIQAIENEIAKYNANVANLSKGTINALTKGETNYTLAVDNEIKKRIKAQEKASEKILKLEKDLEKIRAKKNTLVNSSAYQSGSAQSQRDFNSLVAREQDLENKILVMRTNLGRLTVEIENKFAAEAASNNIKIAENEERRKEQLAKERLARQLAESKKYGNISSASAMRLVGLSGYVTNVEQEKVSIDKLKQARNQLNKLDANYTQTLDALNKKIEQHEHNVKMATDATYRKNQADKVALQQNTTYQGAMSYSRQTKSIQEQIQAIDYLKQARDKLDKTTMSQKDYEDSVKRLNKEIRRQQEEVDRLRDKQGALGKSHRNLMDTTGQLQRKLALLFSVSAIQGYMDKLINVRKEFELQQKSLQVLLRDKDQADKLWQQTVDLAVKSPFRVKELVNYTKQLAAYRIETNKLYDTTKMLSDVSAGLGVDMQRIILAFGQVRAANFLRGTELRQFTEAGIPMLDELAQLFTELEGRAISSGEVFERISKRMVTFKDVEKVFQRMTSESGVFYNMQEEQSKTLFGMISNLHDSIDLMLNDIGRSNDGVIKEMVSFTRDLVDNWRAVATVLKQVGTTLAMIGISNFVSGWRLASNAIVTGSTAAIMSMNGMTGSAARLRIAMHTLGKSISVHPWLMFFGVLASAGHALWEYIDAIDAANKKYDDMSRREISRADALDDLSKKIEGYNKIIKDSNATENERNKAIQGNDTILKQIKAKYPELSTLIVKQKDKTIDLTKAIEEQNKKLIENIALQQKAKGGYFQETLEENYKESIESFGKLESSLSDFKVVAMDAQSKLAQALHNELISQEDYDRFSNLLMAIRKSKDFKTLHKSYQDLTTEIVRNGKEVTKQVPMLGMFANAWLNITNKVSSYKDSLDDLSDNFKNQKNILQVGIQDAFDNVGGGKAGAEAAGEYIESFLDKFNIVDKNIREWAKKEIPKLIKVDFDIIYPTRIPTPSELEPWAKRVKDAVETINHKIKSSNKDVKDTDLFPVPEPGQMKEQYLNVAKAVLDVAKATYRDGQKIEEDATVRRTNMLKGFASEFEAILNLDDKNKNKGKDWMSEVVKGIKEAHQEYVKLNKTLGESDSKQMALDKYAKSFAEAAKNAGLKDISLGQFKFETEEGAIDALEYLKDKLPESAKQARFKLEEAIGDINGEVRIRTKAEDDKLLIEQIEDMFSGYEMSIELQKLNIPKDLAKQLFNVDSVDLSSIRNKISSELAKAQATGGQEDRVKELKKQLDKVDELEDKAMQERLKKYTKYLVKAQGERVKIKMEELRQLNEIETLKFTESQKSMARMAIQQESKQKMDKLDWEDFKNSGMYVQLFEDLEYVSTKALTKMRERLITLKDQLSGLDADDLRNLYNQIEKLDEQLAKRNPYKGAILGINDYIKALKESKRLEIELDKEDAITRGLKRDESSLSEQLAIEQDKYNQMVKSLNVSGQDVNKQYNKVRTLESQLALVKAQLLAQGKLTKELEEQLNLAKAKRKTFTGELSEIGGDISAAANALPQIASELENVFGAMDAGTRDTIDSISTIGSGVGDAIQGFASQNYIQAVSGIAQALGGIFQIGDKKKERQIQREIKFVEDLERAYEKLEKQIDDSYDIDSLKKSYDNANKNLNEQISARERMIQAEKDKKKTDNNRIKEWQQEIEDLREQQAELLKTQVEELGGGYDYKSMTEEFVNAWIDAYEEAGNGLKGLEENFNEFFKNIAIKQAVMNGASKILEPFLNEVNKAIENDFKINDSEMADIDRLGEQAKVHLDEFLKQWYDKWGEYMGGEGQGELSGLQRGIQGVTEETAQIIEAYLNSIRFFVAEQNTYLSQIAASFGNKEVENPMVEQLRIIAAQTSAINSLLQGLVRGGHTLGGSGLKVFIS